jgi:hypothetical protein
MAKQDVGTDVQNPDFISAKHLLFPALLWAFGKDHRCTPKGQASYVAVDKDWAAGFK